MSNRWFPLDPVPSSGLPLPTSAPKRPIQLTIALVLYLVAAALSLAGMVGGILEFPGARQAAERQAEAQGQTLPHGYLDVLLTGIVMGVAAALIFAGVYIVFGLVVWRGAGWARWVLVAFAVLALSGIFTGLLAIAPFVCVVLATVLHFLPSSNEFFRVGRAWKTARPG